MITPTPKSHSHVQATPTTQSFCVNALRRGQHTITPGMVILEAGRTPFDEDDTVVQMGEGVVHSVILFGEEYLGLEEQGVVIVVHVGEGEFSMDTRYWLYECGTCVHLPENQGF